MKATTALAFALSLGASDVLAQTGSQTGSLSREDVQAVSPAFSITLRAPSRRGCGSAPASRRATAVS